MNRFIALPVNDGDSFYLQRKDFSVLVDGGRYTKDFPGLFRDHTKKNEVDILVCTHNDEDHSEGIIKLLEDYSFTCKEIWLPGEWLDCVHDLLESEDEVIRKIIIQADHYFRENCFDVSDETLTLEKIAAKSHKKKLNLHKHDSEENNDHRDVKIIEDTEEILRKNRELFGKRNFSGELNLDKFLFDFYPEHSVNLHLYAYKWKKLINFLKVVEQAVDAADKIRTIADLAYRKKKIPIRWLKYDTEYPAKKIHNNLHVLNARQSFLPENNLTFFEYVALTRFNKESLILYSPPNSDSPGVLFCADSDLNNIELPISTDDLITVPHHGSKHNAKAYKVIEKALRGNLDHLVWVRSSNIKYRPCSEFKNLAGNKFCTNCSDKQSQTVELDGDHYHWRKAYNTRNCVC